MLLEREREPNLPRLGVRNRLRLNVRDRPRPKERDRAGVRE